MSHPHTTTDKLTAARTKLILDQPFLGALVLRLPLRAADPRWCPTSATDARRLYYNPSYIDALSVDQVQFVLAHEALHCALSHFARRQHRQQLRWDCACDHAINPLLKQMGLPPPPGVWVEDSYLGMSAEEIYPTLDVNNRDEPMDRHVYAADNTESTDEQGAQAPNYAAALTSRDEAAADSHSNATADEQAAAGQFDGAWRPPPLSADEQQSLALQWQQRLAGAAQQALQAGKLGGALARLVDELLQPQLPWRMVLARYLTLRAREDYSYSRPSRRTGAALLPQLRSAQLNVVVALDTSGSISAAEMAQCLSEVAALKGQLRARVTLYACDAQLSPDSPWTFEPWEAFDVPPTLRGGGGTSFQPVFEAVAQQGQLPDVLLYFTDGLGDFPAHAPIFPVLWLIKGRATVPWGERVQLN